MKRAERYGITSLEKDFTSEDVCLDFLFDAQHTRTCSCGGSYKRVAGRKQYQCSKCRFQIAPTSGTIFHKSDTPLLLWFKAILAFSNAKSGISAKELERELEVTYKTAWRMLNLIRKALTQSTDKLSGDVEMDSAFMGGQFKSGKDNKRQREAMAAKSVVFGAVQRGGTARIKVMPDSTSRSHDIFLDKTVALGSRLLTDKTNRLGIAAYGYKREAVNHSRGEYVRGDVHVNNVETFWSHVKRSIKGTHKAVSKKHLQSYLDGFVFHYNNRYSDKERFGVLLGTLLRVAK